jgi:polyvinyl alcohol dehydrogenase (cytochrome)
LPGLCNTYAVDAFTGALIWKHQLSDYGLAAGTFSRTSPAVVDGIVYIGTQYVASGPTGWLLAIDRFTGKLIWKTQPDPANPSPVITASPVVADGTRKPAQSSGPRAWHRGISQMPPIRRRVG